MGGFEMRGKHTSPAWTVVAVVAVLGLFVGAGGAVAVQTVSSWHHGGVGTAVLAGPEVRPWAGPIVNGTVTFVETGLPAKVLASKGWYVTLNETQAHPTTNTTTFIWRVGPSGYLVRGPAGYDASTGSGSASGVVNVTTNGTQINVAFTKGPTVDLRVTWAGCAGGFCEPHPWGLSNYAGTGFCPPPSLLVGGGGARACVTPDPWPCQFNVTYCMAGHGTTLVRDLSPGTYGVDGATIHGWVDVMTVNGKVVSSTGPVNLSITKNTAVKLSFSYPYNLTFTEGGLPNNTTWSVTIHGVTESGAAGSAIIFSLPNGTYKFVAVGPAGYVWPPGHGSISYHGGESIELLFSEKK